MNNAPNVIGYTSKSIESMSAQELANTIRQLQQELQKLRAYASSSGIEVSGGSEMTLSTIEHEQQAMINSLENNIKVLTDRLIALQNNIKQQSNDLKTNELSLEEKQAQIIAQETEIENKKKLLLTRDRMLQLSIEKNVYKKKVIYTLLSIIIVIIIMMLVGYAFMNK